MVSSLRRAATFRLHIIATVQLTCSTDGTRSVQKAGTTFTFAPGATLPPAGTTCIGGSGAAPPAGSGSGFSAISKSAGATSMMSMSGSAMPSGSAIMSGSSTGNDTIGGGGGDGSNNSDGGPSSTGGLGGDPQPSSSSPPKSDATRHLASLTAFLAFLTTAYYLLQ